MASRPGWLLVSGGGPVYGERAWGWVLGAASLALAAASTFVVLRPSSPRVCGGTEIRRVLERVPMLWTPQSRLQPPDVVQLLLVALLNVVGGRFCPYKFRREEVPVRLEGESARDPGDTVVLQWLEQRELPATAPIVLLVLGLANTRVSLPGHSLYAWLLKRPWRVVVFEKRGVGENHGGLLAPVFHFFGHPSDLRAAVLRVRSHFPEAPVHLVSFSAGNGVAGSYMRRYPEEASANLRSGILLMGGDDYNNACKLQNERWLVRLVEGRLVQYLKSYFVRSNEGCLRKHSPAGYDAAMSAGTLHELYAASMLHFSGYSGFAEADKETNGFRDGNGWLLGTRAPPTLVVYTADDPISEQPSPEWHDVYRQCTHCAQASFDHGNHLACFQGWSFSRWLNELIFQWVDAVERDAAAGA